MRLIQGDCIEVMKTLEANSVDTVITDPPYGLQFMNKDWDKLWRNQTDADQAYIERTKKETDGLTSRRRNLPDLKSTGIQIQEWHKQWAIEALRVAKPGAIMLCFGGTRTFHRIACGIEDAGWEIRDTMMWLYGSGFSKSYNISKGIDMRESWTQLKARLILERGSICERCRTKDATDLHHALIGRMKSKPELNVEENAELLCKDCHANAGGYDERLEFWQRQCKRYGEAWMMDWYFGLDLKIKERYD